MEWEPDFYTDELYACDDVLIYIVQVRYVTGYVIAALTGSVVVCNEIILTGHHRKGDHFVHASCQNF